jgi:hypothetical protein
MTGNNSVFASDITDVVVTGDVALTSANLRPHLDTNGSCQPIPQDGRAGYNVHD